MESSAALQCDPKSICIKFWKIGENFERFTNICMGKFLAREILRFANKIWDTYDKIFEILGNFVNILNCNG